MRIRFFIICIISCLCSAVVAQDQSGLLDDVTATVEVSATVSNGEFAPLWLSSNRQGIVSPYGNSSYERVKAERSLQTDSLRQWKRGYGLDVQYSQNAQSNFFIQQAYFEVGWKKWLLTVGQKEREIDLRNNQLTSGGMSQGINARPIPEVLLNLDYISIPGTRDWLKFRGRIGYGMTTDGNWQKNWVGDNSTMRYTSNILYHEKAAYLEIGKEDARVPLTFEIGLQMQCQFGGTNYNVTGRNHEGNNVFENGQGVSAFWHAFWPFGSSDMTDGTVSNAEGNQIGSWNMALTWHGKGWLVRTYFERLFEDHSQLFMQYGVNDHLLGLEVQLPKNRFVDNVLVEHINTKYQSGAVFHDGTKLISESVAGRDNYYNHNLYAGWQNWGMAIGNPLITSPIYNKDHRLNFYNNRIKVWHIGLSGHPCSQFSWRMLMTFTHNWGQYSCGWDPYRETHFLLEASYSPDWANGWSGTLGLGLTDGCSGFYGNTKGAQLTIRKEVRL